MTVFLWVNESRERAGELAEKARAVLLANGAKIAERLEDAQSAVVIGGDGTILQCAGAAAPLDIPIVGINLGKIGFIAELEPEDVNLLSRVAEGGYRVERRLMLEVEYGDFRDITLNDAVVFGRGMSAFEIGVDGAKLTEFNGDGVIISTPTGSTAYSMSAGGTIAEPSARLIGITPICPHGFHTHPFLLSDLRGVTVTPLSKGAKLTCDGREEVDIKRGETVYIKRYTKDCLLIKLKDRNFYQIISDKLGRVR